MATLTKTGGTGTTGHVSGNGVAKTYVQSTVIDGTSTSLTSGDVYQAINLPANSIVMSAGIDVITAGTGTGTLALGDGTVTYVAAATQSAGQMTSGDALAELAVTYAAADTLDVTVATADVNSKVRVWALIADIDGIGDTEAGDTFA
jgi:uncharacterized cupredoxin-like copper-binding protein|tara:strand:- start:40 stop:480 length:441 start_codon:yes stop_codon:yes gene_type:complete